MSLNFKEALSKLKKSEEFKKFKKENGSAYLCSAFFIVDYEKNSNKVNINFQLSDEKIADFSVNDSIILKIEELMVKKKVKRLKESVKIDLEKAESIIKKEIEEKKINGKVNKIIAILGPDDEKEIWNVTCFLSSLKILNIHIDADTGKVLKTEEKALGDFFNKPADYIG